MAKTEFDFLTSFNKELEKIEGISLTTEPPRYWYSMGNYVLNRIMSGSFYKGIPQGRITNLAGASGAGKSFLATNILRAAQEAGAYCLVVDSENALDPEFVQKIGVDVTNKYRHVGVSTIPQVVSVVSSFLRIYRKGAGDDLANAPHVFILIDSLNMLMTETEVGHYSKGDTKGDQGQRNKQLKSMLTSFVQDIKDLNVIMVVTSQVYKNQDPTNGEGLWIVSDAVKYSASQLVLLSKLKLKDDSGKPGVVGIRMKAEGNKTRFTKPFQTVTVEVPYDTGMDPLSGLKDVAVDLGVIEKRGSRYQVVGEDVTWYERDIGEHLETILLACEAKSHQYIQVKMGNMEEVEDTETAAEIAKRRQQTVPVIDSE